MATIHRLGLLAPEFPPQIGGMSQLAYGLAKALADLTHVTVYTTPDNGLAEAPFAQISRLSRCPGVDAGWLNAESIDAWLLLNAGLTPLAKSLDKPVYVYMHGNDFLEPWIPCGPPWLERIRRPYAAVIRQSLRRKRRSAEVVSELVGLLS